MMSPRPATMSTAPDSMMMRWACSIQPHSLVSALAMGGVLERGSPWTIHATPAVSVGPQQAFLHHGLDGAVKSFQALIDVGGGMHSGEHPAAARHQVHAPHLQGLSKTVLHRRRDVFQRIGIESVNGVGTKIDVEGGRLAVDTRRDFVAFEHLSQADP